MKGTILYAHYDENTKISTVTKHTKYGTFTKSVKVHPDDFDIANQYDGCFFAEMKCDIAAYKERAKLMKERAKGILHAYNVLTQADGEGSDRFTEWMRLADQVSVAFDNADQAYDTYKILKDSYSAFIETSLRSRRELRAHIKKKCQY